MTIKLQRILSDLAAGTNTWITIYNKDPKNQALLATARALIEDYDDLGASILSQAEKYTDEQIAAIIFPVGGESVVVPVLAQTTISKYDIVTSDGFLADTSVVGKRNRTLGFANTNILNTFVGDVVTEGKISNPTWSWTTGLPIFLNGTSPSQICPSVGFTQILGIAIKVDTISVLIHQSILL